MNQAFSNFKTPWNATYWPVGYSSTSPIAGDAATNGNGALATTRLAVFLCPADPGDPLLLVHWMASPGGNLAGAKTNYDFVGRLAELYSCNSWRSSGGLRYMFGQNSDCTIAQVTDGMSNTFMLAETTLEVWNGFCPAWGYRAWAMFGLDPGHPWATRTINDWDTLANTTFAPSKFGRVISFGMVGSTHRGGATFAMGDGSVRFVNENTSKASLEKMTTIAEGVPANLD
jgi:prepilin-type processing-associated H-X9-DG protein